MPASTLRAAVTVLALLLGLLALGRETVGAVPAEVGTPDQDDIHVAISGDGDRFTALGSPLFRKASSPDLVRLNQGVGRHDSGIYLAYFVDFSNWTGRPQTERLAVAASRDGVTWSAKSLVTFDIPSFHGRATDPSVVQLADGHLRIYFMTPGRDGREIRSAISEDGIAFTIDSGIRIRAPGNVDVYHNDTEWFLFVGNEERNITELATSLDGLDWSWVPDFQVPGVCPGVLPLPNGGAFLYVNDGAIASFSFDAASRSCRKITRNVLPAERGIVGDPSPVWADEGVLLLFKRRDTPLPPPGFSPPPGSSSTRPPGSYSPGAPYPSRDARPGLPPPDRPR